MPVAVVTGMIATYNLGGVVWDYGQYALGFLQRELAALSPTLAARWHVRGDSGATFGMAEDDLLAVVADADVFLNVSGAALVREAYLPSRRKILIDTDPGMNHFGNYRYWDAADTHWQESAGWRAHDLFFTYAEAIGQRGCALPSMGIDWRITRAPVVLDRWSHDGPGTSWTTVTSWDANRKTVEHEGYHYGGKELEFEKIERLPTDVEAPLEIAVGGVGPPVERWRALGWSVRPSLSISRTADDYRRYVEQSRGELSVAKNAYVATGSGWFSCRSCCYLAAGRPVVVQDTGFTERIPVGRGVIAFRNRQEAADGVRAVERDYEMHSAAARATAESTFAADVVLCRLLDDAGVR
jgi:hypothetical protein